MLLAVVLLSVVLLSVVTPAQDAPTRLLRYPAVSADLIAFVYAGDIWLVPIAGGYARQLTSGDGEELFPRFSPDGRTIAFTGQYRRAAPGLHDPRCRRHAEAVDLL